MASIDTKGLYFVFKMDDITVKAKGSAFMGKESVYFNDELVSERKSLNKVSKHPFEKEGKKYEVIFYMPNIRKGQLECLLFQDGQLIEKQIKQIKTKNKAMRFSLLILVCTVISLVSIKFNIPTWAWTTIIASILTAGMIYTFRNLECEDIPVTYAKNVKKSKKKSIKV